jgi:hypothetical protein
MGNHSTIKLLALKIKAHDPELLTGPATPDSLILLTAKVFAAHVQKKVSACSTTTRNRVG